MRKVLVLTALSAVTSFGYFRNVYTPPGGGEPVVLKRGDADRIQISMNRAFQAGLTVAIANPANNKVISDGSDPYGAIQSALAVWNTVSTSSVRFKPLVVTDTGHVPDDLANVIVMAATAADLSVVGATGGPRSGALAVTDSRFVVEAGEFKGVNLEKGQIFDADIVFNPNFLFSTEGAANSLDLQSVVTHELGHLLGSNHSSLFGATMYPFAGPNQRILSADDVAYANAVYPAPGTGLGTLSGRVTLADGTTAVKSPILVILDQATGVMTGTLGATDGTYTLQVPPGNYLVYAEPFKAPISPGNFYFVDTAQVSTGYLPTFLGSAASPQTVAVAAGGTTNAPLLRVVEGTNSLTLPSIGYGITGANGDIRTVSTLNIANVLTSGQTFDIGFVGGGIDGTTTFQLLGVTGARINTVRVDSVVNFSGQPMVRINVTLPTVQKSSLATLVITKGTSIMALSGIFVIVPPQPIITSVQDSQSARNSIVGGSWIAIYGSNLAPPGTRVWGNADFVNGNLLPRQLDGVSVQINGLAASIYYTLPTQMGIQAPSDLGTLSTVDVVVTNNGSVSRTFRATPAQFAPSLFNYPAGGKTYAAALNSSFQLIGDPLVTAGAVKARAGQSITFYVNGLGRSESATLIAAPQDFAPAVNVTVGGLAAQVTYKGLVSAGLFQVNAILPANLPSGDQTVVISTQSINSPSGVSIPVQ